MSGPDGQRERPPGQGPEASARVGSPGGRRARRSLPTRARSRAPRPSPPRPALLEALGGRPHPPLPRRAGRSGGLVAPDNGRFEAKAGPGDEGSGEEEGRGQAAGWSGGRPRAELRPPNSLTCRSSDPRTSDRDSMRR